MEPRKHEKIANQWLDAALKQYGKAEPRAGLEGRMLASLRAEKERPVERRSWWPAVVAVAAIVVVGGVIFLGREHLGANKEIATVQAPVVHQPQSSVTSEHKPTMKIISVAPETRKSARHRQSVHVVETEPRLEQFPAPRPLSEQERMLARYVEERPQEAKLVAQAQAALLGQDLLEFEKQQGSSEPPPNSSR
jgi:hypothetical protein